MEARKTDSGDFYQSFYDYCKKIVNVWKEKEWTILNDYEKNGEKDIFYKEMEKTVPYKRFNQKLLNEPEDFCNYLEQCFSFDRCFGVQKDCDDRELFARELYSFLFYSTDGNRTGIEFKVFSDFPREDIRLKGNELLRELRGFDRTKREGKDFFDEFWAHVINRWYRIKESNAKERDKRKRSIKSIIKILEKECFSKQEDKNYCLSILREEKKFHDYYSQRYGDAPMIGVNVITEIKRITKDVGIYQKNTELQDKISEIECGLKISSAGSLNKPIKQDSVKTFIDFIEDEKNLQPGEKKQETRLEGLAKAVERNIKYVVMNKRDDMNIDNLNRIARELIRLVFSGYYDLTGYVDYEENRKTYQGLNSLSEELRNRFEDYDEYSVFEPTERHGIGEIIRRRLEAFGNRLERENKSGNVNQEDFVLLNNAINGVKELLPGRNAEIN